jgi:protease-4
MEQTHYSTTQSSYNPPPQKNKSGKGCWIALIILGLLMLAFIVISTVFVYFIGSSFREKPQKVQSNSVLHLVTAGRLQEVAMADPLGIFQSGADPVSHFQVLSALKKAEKDDRIQGIFFRGTDFRAGYAKAEEIREQIIDFKKSGKFVYVFIEFGNEFDYFMASVADSIFMAPEGILEMNGFAISELFWSGTYDKIGVKFYVEQWEEYKSAAESYIRNGFSEPARENLYSILDARYSSFIEKVANERNFDKKKLKEILSKGVYQAQELKDLGLVDELLPEQQVRILMEEKLGQDLHLVRLDRYIHSKSGRQGQPVNKDHKVALVVASGIMVSGETGDGALRENLLADRTFIRHLNKARDDDDISAIILRIDTPGGSVLAADAMYHAIAKAKEYKPIYASMSDLAASGGYYIAAACDTIIAHPQTLTGSIGVVSIIPNFSGTLDKLDANVDTVGTSSSAHFLNPFIPFSEKDRQTFRSLSKTTYERFVSKVAKARDFEYESARKLARGRVWTGQDAFKVGLVDTLGGLQETFSIVKRRLGIPQNELISLKIYPKPQDSLSALIRLLNTVNSPSPRSILDETLPLWSLLPETQKLQLLYHVQLANIAREERLILALPFLPIMD